MSKYDWLDMDELLETILVVPADDQGPKGWWAVGTATDGIIAYFRDEITAENFKLYLINLLLYPITSQNIDK